MHVIVWWAYSPYCTICYENSGAGTTAWFAGVQTRGLWLFTQRVMLRKSCFISLLVLLLSVASGHWNPAVSDPPSTLSVTYCVDCVPYQFTNADGKADGQIIDFWKSWSEKTGVSVQFVPARWNKTLENVRDGVVDAHAGLFFSPERDTYLDYGSSLTDTDTHVFFHEDVAFPRALAELRSYRIGVVSGDLVEGWLTKRLGEGSVIGFKNYDAIVAALRSGEIKLFAADTQTGLFHLGRAGLLTKFRHEKLNPLYGSQWFVASQSGNHDLLDFINAGMSQISSDERLRITRAWASGTRSEDSDSVIISIDSYYPPLSSIGIDGSAQGLMIDIWRAWGEQVDRKIVFKAGNWQQTLDDIRSGEADIHFGLFRTEDREQWMAFSQPVQSVKTGLYTKAGSTEGATLDALKGKRVAAVAGSYQAAFIEQQHPAISLYPVAERMDYLMALMRGEVVAVVEEVTTMTAALARGGLGGVVSRNADLFENELVAGVRKDNKALLNLVNAGLDEIPRSVLAEIEARWIPNPADRYFSTNTETANLTQAERKWIAEHPSIRIAATPDWPPFEWEDESTGQHRGISADFMRLIAKKTGLRIEHEFGDWRVLVEKLKSKQLDVVPGLNRTSSRDEYLLFTEAFTEYFSVIFTQNDRDDITAMSDLNGKTVAVEAGYALSEVLARDYPEIRLSEVDTTIQALQMVSSGKADAFVGNQLVGNHLLKKYLISNVQVSGFYNKTPGRFRLGIRKDWPVLRDILNKGLAAITEEEREHIIKTHTGMQLSMEKRVRLTDAERQWLHEHEPFRLGVDSSWPPFEYIEEDGAYSGLASGYVNLLSKRLDVDMKPNFALTWSEAFETLQMGGDIDIMPAIAATPERRKFMHFTEPYLSFPLVLVTRKDAPYVGGLVDLDEKRIGVIRGYYTHEMLKNNHEKVIPHFVSSVADGLKEVENGKADAFFDNLAAVTFEMDRLGTENLKVAAPTSYKSDLSIGVRKDWPELVPILNKALASLSKSETTAVRNEWMSVTVSLGIDLKTILSWAVPIGGSALVIIGVVVFWNRRLGIEVTERIRAEHEASLARDAAEEATRAKATFLATMSHEIRTPMGGVIGMVDLLKQTKMTDDQRQMIKTVGESAHSLLTIINDILDFSKIEAGKLELEEIPISVRDIVEGAGEALAVSTRNKGVGLSVYVDPDIPDTLLGDQVRLRQILFNFGSNAVKFTEKGRILVRADLVPSAAEGQATVRFQVVDQGIGIPKEAQEKLFQAFTQVEASTTRRFGGTGLGLSICQRLTELMDGDIGVESVPGEGSTFSSTITLPIGDSPADDGDNIDLGGLRILFVHKEDDMRSLMPRYLEHRQATVSTAADIEDVPSLAGRATEDGNPFDVVCLGPSWAINEQISTIEAMKAEENSADLCFVVLCRERERSGRVELDNTVYVDTGPLRRENFVRSVAVAVGRAAPVAEQDDQAGSRRRRTAPSVSDAEAMGQLVLLAEDNVTNQDVIGRQLSMLGYAFEVAGDGKEALALMEKRSYGVLLTDCHMPTMDGFELTKSIRDSEEGTDSHFPVIAVTASVMKEEIDKCFAAGMDDYLAKPLEMDKLEAMLQRWIPGEEHPEESPETPVEQEEFEEPLSEPDEEGDEGIDPTSPSNVPIDESALKGMFGDDEEMFLEILREFVAPATANAEEISQAYSDRSLKGVAGAAHKLKSSARSVGANELADMCQKLELAGKAGEWVVIEETMPDLPNVVRQVVEHIQSL